MLRCPDVAMVRRSRVPTGKGGAGWLEWAPNLAVEVAGDSQSIADLTAKVVDYLKAGAQLVWVLDPQARKVLVHTPTGPVRILSLRVAKRHFVASQFATLRRGGAGSFSTILRQASLARLALRRAPWPVQRAVARLMGATCRRLHTERRSWGSRTSGTVPRPRSYTRCCLPIGSSSWSAARRAAVYRASWCGRWRSTFVAVSWNTAVSVWDAHVLRAAGGLQLQAEDFCPSCIGRLRLNPHFHTLALDGVYVRDPGGELRFEALPPPTEHEVEHVARRMKKAWSDGTVALLFEPLDLIARICAMIPPPRFNMVRYHGVLALASALRDEVVPQRPKAQASPPPGEDPDDVVLCRHRLPGQQQLFADEKQVVRRSRRRPWAWLLRHVFEVDVTFCPQCGGRLRWLETATSSKAIARLLAAHGLGPEPPPPLPLYEPEQLELDFGA